MMLTLDSVGGRYPFGLARYSPDNIRASLRVCGDKVVIRIDDLEVIDRWEEFRVDLGSVLQLVNALTHGNQHGERNQ